MKSFGVENISSPHTGSVRDLQSAGYQVMALIVVKCSVIQAHWQSGTLDFSLWFSPLSGEILLIVCLIDLPILWLSPLSACVIV